MAKYDKKSQDKVKKSMEELKEGKLKSGSGQKVTDRKQAIAIGLSEARKEGSKAPGKAKSEGATKKPATAAKKKTTTAKKKEPAKKIAAKKTTTKKSAAKN